MSSPAQEQEPAFRLEPGASSQDAALSPRQPQANSAAVPPHTERSNHSLTQPEAYFGSLSSHTLPSSLDAAPHSGADDLSPSLPYPNRDGIPHSHAHGQAPSPLTTYDTHPDSSSEHTTEGGSGGGGTEDPMTHQRLPIRRSLGLYACTVLLGGGLILLAILGFLVFLWAGAGPTSDGQGATTIWRKIMLDDWAIRTVTLSSLALRVVTATQATICTSLLAALFLEKHSTPVSGVVRLSVMRSINDGPWKLVQHIASYRSVSLVLNLEVILLLILMATTLSTQFSSTILLSDFNTTSLVQFPQQMQLNLTLSTDNNGNEALGGLGDIFHPLSEGGSHELFGEMHSSVDATPDANGLSDTGLLRRAIIPFEKYQRTTLRSFSGPSFLLNTRVLCARPSMNVTMSIRTDVKGNDYGQIDGDIFMKETLEGLGVRYIPCEPSYSRKTKQDSCLPKTFTCTFPATYVGPNTPLGWPTSMCHLPREYESYIGLFSWDTVSEDEWAVTPRLIPFIVLASNVTILDNNKWGIDNDFRQLRDPIPHGEWNSYQISQDSYLNASVCFVGLNTTISSVEISSNRDLSEPTLKWNRSTQALDTQSAQVLLGATNASIEERGVFSIDSIQEPAPLSSFDVDAEAAFNASDWSTGTFWRGLADAVLLSGQINQSLALCTACYVKGGEIAPGTQATFMGIINSSGRAAKAIEALFMDWGLNWFYNGIFPRLDVPGHITVEFSVTAQAPVSWKGITAVLSIVGVYSLTMGLIVGLYITQIKYTSQGNVWQAMSQVMSNETDLLLEQSRKLTDEEIRASLKGRDTLVRIESSGTAGRIEVIADQRKFK